VIYLKTFESYLSGGRQPLYTWVVDFKRMIESDQLNVGNPTYDKNHKKRSDTDQLKSISLSRSSSFIYYKTYRIVLDTNKLIKDGYIPEPFDEFSAAFNSKLGNTSKPRHFKYLKAIRHGLNIKFDPKINDEEEYEERIYKDIKDIGKYILYINMQPDTLDRISPLVVEYIKKYPHIEIRKFRYIKSNHTQGNSKNDKILLDGGEILMDINKIREMEKQKELIS